MLPDLLKKKLDRKLDGSETIWISRGEAMRQLPTGAVKIPFADVVRMAPQTFLSPDAEMLATIVNLPLQEILPKIKTLPRRLEQRVVEVPEDLQPVFGAGAGDASKAVQPIAAPVAATAAVTPTAPTAAPASLNIPAPTPKRVPIPEARTVQSPALPSAEEPVSATQPLQSPGAEEAYAPPAPKTLAPQAAISLKPPTPAPVPAPLPQPAPVPMTPAAPAMASDTPNIPLGAIFGQPDKMDWTPQEVVEKAAALRGVAGALITTTDGLPVAFHLPADLSGNMVAAFVPQLYMRVVQYTRDLKLGDAKHITIIVENTPLQIFKSGGVYFTALGRPNENLPKPQLTAIALALGRQSPG